MNKQRQPQLHDDDIKVVLTLSDTELTKYFDTRFANFCLLLKIRMDDIFSSSAESTDPRFGVGRRGESIGVSISLEYLESRV